MKIKKSEISALKKYVRLTNYLSTAQIYLKDNILLERELQLSDIKPRLLGHWGTCPGINFVYAQVNRLIQKTKSDFLFVVGPGHGFPAIQANLFVEKSLTNFYPPSPSVPLRATADFVQKGIPYSAEGIKEICSKFSAPYGYPSHSNPAAPGAILEGGELGYSLSVSFGAVLDNPNLIVACLVGDGESETGPLAAAWHANKILSPKDSGTVLPIVHLNGYKISGPTVLGRMSDAEIMKLFEGYGYEPFIVDHDRKGDVYAQMAETMDECHKKIRAIQKKARCGQDVEKPRWPMIVLRTPKGWTGTKFDHGKKLEGNCASHQVILPEVQTDIEELKELEKWLRSYKVEELFDLKNGELKLDSEVKSLVPKKGKACGSQKYAIGGEMVRALRFPSLSKLAHRLKTQNQKLKTQNVELRTQKTSKRRGVDKVSNMKFAGRFMEQVFKLNKKNKNLRLFSPDETYSNKLDPVFTQTARSWQWPIKNFDIDMTRDGRVMELLSEHTLFGMLHGYTVTGRHGIFASYEAFTQIVASMADQYAKFIKASRGVPFRKPLPALNLILTSLLERQDHNGFSHQNPSLISSMMEKDGDFISTYLPPDANSLLVTMQKIFEVRDALNLVVAGKKNLPQWLTLKEAKEQMEAGIMEWKFASDKNPQIVLVASGDYVTQETLAAIMIAKEFLPKLRVRFVNVSELTALGVGDPRTTATSKQLDQFFTKDKPVIFNFHGYPQTIKKLLFDYTGNQRIKVNGYEEEGSTTTPFDMNVRNGTSRYHLVWDIGDKLFANGGISKTKHKEIETAIKNKLQDHHDYILKYGVDPEEITNWKWNK